MRSRIARAAGLRVEPLEGRCAPSCSAWAASTVGFLDAARDAGTQPGVGVYIDNQNYSPPGARADDIHTQQAVYGGPLVV